MQSAARLAPRVEFPQVSEAVVAALDKGPALASVLPLAAEIYWGSISPGRHVLLNQGSNGP